MGNITTFDAARKNLAAIRDFVETKATEMGADADVIYEITAAVDEAATNIIIHGYQDKGGELEVEADGQGGMLVVRLRDRAPEYDPTKLPPPDLSIPLEERPLGGMGFHIIRKYTTSVEYHRRDGGGNELTLFRQIR
jgi:serine/threonine-protein kinase RsbW